VYSTYVLRKRNIQISKIEVKNTISSVRKVLKSGNLAQGRCVEEFEKTFAEILQVKHAIAVNNGTSALFLALKSLDLNSNSEIITTPLTFGATLNAILAAGATARFADINQDDFNVDPNSISERICENTKVLLPVHLYGQMSNMTEIMNIAKSNKLFVIEDAAQATFAEVNNKMAGSYGIGAFSFYATKNFTSGEGGIITTDDDDISEKIRILRNQGMKSRYEYTTTSLNYRMNELQASMLIPQIKNRSKIQLKRSKNAELMNSLLAESNLLTLPNQNLGKIHVWHQYTLILKGNSRLNRDDIVKKLQDRGISAGVYYPKLVFDYECFRNHERVIIEETPKAKMISKNCLSLPVHQYLTKNDVKRIAYELLEIIYG
jgi:perosamine synthetase